MQVSINIKVILGSKWLVFESVLTLVCVGIQFAPHNGRKKKVTTNQLNNGIITFINVRDNEIVGKYTLQIKFTVYYLRDHACKTLRKYNFGVKKIEYRAGDEAPIMGLSIRAKELSFN